MVFTKENYKEVKRVVLDGLALTQEKATKIADKVANEFKDNIESGSVKPSLKPSTMRAKRQKRLSKPEAPLYGTGELANSLKLGAWGPTFLEIVSGAKVAYQWHTTNRATGVPRRDVLDHKRLEEIGYEVINGN